jgi:transcription initiation factor TFIIIB Brf1 subunit/transcription initiation factor TFIIB
VERRATEIAGALQGRRGMNGVSPTTIAAVSVYLAARELGEPRAEVQVSGALSTTDVTLRNTIKRVERQGSNSYSQGNRYKARGHNDTKLGIQLMQPDRGTHV